MVADGRAADALTVGRRMMSSTKATLVCLGFAAIVSGCASQARDDALTLSSVQRMRARLGRLDTSMTRGQVADILHVQPGWSEGCLHHWSDHYSSGAFLDWPQLHVSFKADRDGRMRYVRAVLEVERDQKENWPK